MAKKSFFKFVTKRGRRYLQTPLDGVELFNLPLLNKSTAFTEEERKEFKLKGLLPTKRFSIDQQVMRISEHFNNKTKDLDKFIYLQGLMDRNETLYFKFILDNLEMLLPIIYTPTVGQACKEFAHIFRRPRGLYITPDDESSIDELIGNWPYDDVRIVVMTDGERILGLGDLGANGMGIPIGKLALYTVAGGIHPSNTMPICLDVGTNNKDLLGDPLYLGVHKKRISKEKLDRLVEKTLKALKKRFPSVLVQFEDFAMHNSFRLLSKFQNRASCFNDDIQGTGAVALAGIIAASKKMRKSLKDMKFVIAGSGSAGIGIATQIAEMLKQYGINQGESLNRVYLLDSKGLLDMKTVKYEFQRPFARSVSGWRKKDLLNVIKEVKPDVLIGTTGTQGLFTNEMIKLVSGCVETPLIMPLSNPNSCSEANPYDVIRISDGRALVATGSPFPPFTYNGRVYKVSQCNNVYIFPGIGLGVLASKARRVTQNMVLTAAKTLASMVTSDRLKLGKLYPSMSNIRKVSFKIAVEVAIQASRDGVSSMKPSEIKKSVADNVWEPEYLPYLKA